MNMNDRKYYLKEFGYDVSSLAFAPTPTADNILIENCVMCEIKLID